MKVHKNENSEKSNALETYMSEFSAVRHEEVQAGFKLGKTRCTTFVDIARDAFLKYYRDSFMEIRDVTFSFQPFSDSEKPGEIRTVVKKEMDALEFIISGRENGNAALKESKWNKYIEGRMLKLYGDRAPECGLEEIKKRYGIDNETYEVKYPMQLPGVRGMWDCCGLAYVGSNESLIEFNIPEEVIEEVKGKVLHPCITDYIVAASVECAAGPEWIPCSYGSLRLYGDIHEKVFVYMRKRLDQTSGSLDISIMDEQGNTLVDIEDYDVICRKQGDEQESKAKTGDMASETDVFEGRSVVKHKSPANYADAGQKSPEGQYGRLPEELFKDPNGDISRCISNLTWRQMNCRDRTIALLMGCQNHALINCFKFLIGAKRGYNLEGYGLGNLNDWNEGVLNNSILNKLGYTARTNIIKDQESLHDTIASFLDEGRPVGIWFDEYYLFYTPFYLKSHTGHIAAVNGYSKDKRLYSVFDHNHLRVNNTSQIINYGQFYSTYETVENIYSNLTGGQRFVFSLEEIQEGRFLEEKDMKRLLSDVLTYLVDNSQAGCDIETVYKNIRDGDGSINVESIDGLYMQLGGKELMVDTLLNYICRGVDNESIIKELSHRIVQDSNKLVKGYVTSLYRGKKADVGMYEEYYSRITNDTQKLFRNIAKNL